MSIPSPTPLPLRCHLGDMALVPHLVLTEKGPSFTWDCATTCPQAESRVFSLTFVHQPILAPMPHCHPCSFVRLAGVWSKEPTPPWPPRVIGASKLTGSSWEVKNNSSDHRKGGGVLIRGALPRNRSVQVDFCLSTAAFQDLIMFSLI